MVKNLKNRIKILKIHSTHTYQICYTVLPISFRLEGVVLVSLRRGSAGGLGADAGKGKGHWRSLEPCSPILVSLSSPGIAVQLVVSAQVGSRPSKNQGAVKHHFPPLGSGLHIKKKKKKGKGSLLLHGLISQEHFPPDSF